MNLGSRIAAWFEQKRGGIPEGWIEIEWIKAVNHAYINTKVFINRDIKTSVKFSFDGTSRSYYQHPIGSSNYNGSTGSFGFYTASLEDWSTTWCALWNRERTNVQWEEGVIYESSNNGNSFSLKADGVFVFDDFKVTRRPVDFTYVNPISLFGILTDRGTISNMFLCRLYSAEIDDTKGNRRMFVCVRNKTTGEVAMCDTLSGDIYRNAGEGYFVAGPDKPANGVGGGINA